MTVKMTMSTEANACKISMLWNWYTIDLCFIARSWHVRTKGGFAGSCIGVFFLVVASQWLHRFSREYDNAIKRTQVQELEDNLMKSPFLHTLGHTWLGRGSTPLVQHLVRSILFTVEWGLSYIIMLLFMYYNGYIIISCILGAFVGKFLFTYNEPIGYDDEDRKCCK